MPEIVIFDSEKISVRCDPDKRLIHHQIHQYCHGEPFRSALTAGANALEKYRAVKWLSDDRANGPLSPEDEEWATKTWFPKVRAMGWKYWAMVQPVQVVGQMNVARFVKLYGELGITAQIFTEVPAAMIWLDARDRALSKAPDSK